MDIEREFDLSEPIELQTVFRTPTGSGVMEEYQSEISITWEKVDAIQEYPFEDTWVKFNGPKFWIHLYGNLGTHIVLGEYKTFKKYFDIFRKWEFSKYNGSGGDSND